MPTGVRAKVPRQTKAIDLCANAYCNSQLIERVCRFYTLSFYTFISGKLGSKAQLK